MAHLPLEIIIVLAGVAGAFALSWILVRLFLRRTRAELGIRKNWELVYSDSPQKKGPLLKLILKEAYIVGRPDAVYRIKGTDKAIVIEDKHRQKPHTLYTSHVMQLAAYILMVEAQMGLTVVKSYLRYRDGSVEIPVTDDLRQEVLDLILEMAHARHEHMFRNHDQPGRCVRCEYRFICGQSLADDRPRGNVPGLRTFRE